MKRFFRKLLSGIFALRFVIITLLLFFAIDTALAVWAPVERSTLFTRNDYEKTIMSHGNETKYEKVLYGNSTLISSYIEEQSKSGYVNFGLDYGTARDLYEMLTQGYLAVTGELVIDLNYFVLLDELETNPTYPWHRHTFEPYVYFQRDRLAPVINGMATNIMHRSSPLNLPVYDDMRKSVYHGVLTDFELEKGVQRYRDLFWGLGLDSYKDNLEALAQIADWCAERDVRLRVFWGPWNNDVPVPDSVQAVTSAANEVLTGKGIEVTDMSNSLERKYFHDVGHLNYEYGAVYFTEVLDKWLQS